MSSNDDPYSDIGGFYFPQGYISSKCYIQIECIEPYIVPVGTPHPKAGAIIPRPADLPTTSTPSIVPDTFSLTTEFSNKRINNPVILEENSTFYIYINYIGYTTYSNIMTRCDLDFRRGINFVGATSFGTVPLYYYFDGSTSKTHYGYGYTGLGSSPYMTRTKIRICGIII